MIWESTITTTVIDDKGNDKVLKRSFIMENFETFGEVELKLYEEFGQETGFEICSIKKSKLKEIVNEKPSGCEGCKIYLATISDFFTEENGTVKEIKYVVALFAGDAKEAMQSAMQYILQGLEDMELKQLKETKFEDVLR